jgi:hypothetical protein
MSLSDQNLQLLRTNLKNLLVGDKVEVRYTDPRGVPYATKRLYRVIASTPEYFEIRNVQGHVIAFNPETDMRLKHMRITKQPN